jgi:TRAP-type mannitol/chloroaromatic compound transport system permease small subunit
VPRHGAGAQARRAGISNVSGLLGISRLIDEINERIGRVAAWAIVVAVVVSAVNAIIRKVFGTSSNAWLELQWYLFGAVFMLCASWALKDNEHIRIDIVSSRYAQRTRNFIEMLGHIAFLLPLCLVMVWLSLPFFWRSFSSGEVSTNAGGLVVWPAKGLILLGFILLLAQWLSELIKRLAIIRGELPETLSGGHQAAAEAEAERLLAELAEAEKEPPQSGTTKIPR